MIQNCPKCNVPLEDLGTAGFNNSTGYHNRHERKCPKCNKRYDINDCTCGADHELANSLHHGTDHNCNHQDHGNNPRIITCDEAHGEDLLECGHDKPQQIHAKKEFQNKN